MIKKFNKFFCVMLLASCMLPAAARADSDSDYIPSAMKDQYHAYAEMGVCVVSHGKASEVSSALANPKTRILCLQVPFDKFDLSMCPAIMDWVRGGHSLWFYDSRYAPYFGMKGYALSADQFKGRNETGTLGDHKYKGIACTVMASGNHEVMTGVGQCTVFVPQLEDNVYSAVSAEGDTVPLLQFAAGSPALAALRRDGRGAVVFKPLLWPEAVSGKRFQANLLEYSAGYGVPGAAGEGRVGDMIGSEAPYVESGSVSGTQIPEQKEVTGVKTRNSVSSPASDVSRGNENATSIYAKPISSEVNAADNPEPDIKGRTVSPADSSASQGLDMFVLRSGEVVYGRCTNKEISLEGTGESLKTAPSSLKSLRFSANSWSTDKCETEDGRTVNGVIITSEFSVSVSGGTRTFKKDELKEIVFSAGGRR